MLVASILLFTIARLAPAQVTWVVPETEQTIGAKAPAVAAA